MRATHLHISYENEPTILKDSHYVDNKALFKLQEVTCQFVFRLSLNCCSFSVDKFDELKLFIDQLNISSCVSIIAL